MGQYNLLVVGFEALALTCVVKRVKWSWSYGTSCFSLAIQLKCFQNTRFKCLWAIISQCCLVCMRLLPQAVGVQLVAIYWKLELLCKALTF